MGSTLNVIGEKKKALEFYNQALQIFRTLGIKRGEASTLNNIGVIYGWLNERNKAISYYEQSLSIRRIIGDKKGEAASSF